MDQQITKKLNPIVLFCFVFCFFFFSHLIYWNKWMNVQYHYVSIYFNYLTMWDFDLILECFVVHVWPNSVVIFYFNILWQCCVFNEIYVMCFDVCVNEAGLHRAIYWFVWNFFCLWMCPLLFVKTRLWDQ